MAQNNFILKFFGQVLVIKQQMLLNQISGTSAGSNATNASYSNFMGQQAGKEQQVLK
jgi:hypothetical protein